MSIITQIKEEHSVAIDILCDALAMPCATRSICIYKFFRYFVRNFFQWYNSDHYHSGIYWLTPESVHYERHAEILEKRYQTILKAYFENPIRFNNKYQS